MKLSKEVLREQSLRLHSINKGKVAISSKVHITSAYDLSLAYSPGVAEPCLEIRRDPELVYKYTGKGNTIAVISDGSAALGLGNIGPVAALPIIEGKCILFKQFAGIDAFPICLQSKSADQLIDVILSLEPSLGGINLEDIAAPDCFYIEQQLISKLKIPVFHDDQHGTAIVAAAGIMNALKLVGKQIEDVDMVINGAGAGGVATTKLLLKLGAKNIIVCDTKGIIHKGRKEGMNPFKDEICSVTNPYKRKGSFEDVMADADIFIGLSSANLLHAGHVQKMRRDPIIFALANPDPEILPEIAREAGAKVVATGRSDYPNQVNNVLAFPGVFRGALEVGAAKITDEMKMAAVLAISGLVGKDELSPTCIIPDPFDPRVVENVSKAVAEAAIIYGVERRPMP